MSAREQGAARSGETRLTIGLSVALVAAVLPLVGVVAVGPWLPGVLALAAALLAIGYATRRLRLPAVAVTLIELAAWAIAITAVFLREDSWFGIIPTPESLRLVPEFIQRASTQILLGVAPLEPTLPVSFLIVAAMGLLTIALDHVVMTARMPLLASVALVAVWLIPAIAVPSGVDVLAFAFLAAAVLYMIRAETRTRETSTERGGGAGVTAVAASIGVAAIVASVIGAPLLPAPVLTAAGNGPMTTINPTLDLGNDLRRPEEAQVLTYRTNASSLPYLRVATLSVFMGDAWEPDRLRSVPLSLSALGEVETDPDVRVNEYRTTIQVTQLSSAYLPVSYPAVSLDGVDGLWRAVPYNRTVLTAQGNARGQSYDVITHVPKPTLEQIRAADASIREPRVDVYAVPPYVPDIVAETAREVTAGARTDYDKLIALQTWFRGPDFTYSLLAPVEDGFDGTGAQAIAEFLRVREGYCVHFAASFALMARTLDMPSRIVVGFLPGGYTGDIDSGERVAEVKTSQLHAWPEVYFEGIGWVGFEPTKGLGDVTNFPSESVGVPDDGGQQVGGPTPTVTPSPVASSGPPERPDDPSAGAAGSGVQLIDMRPFLIGLLIALIVGATPGTAAFVRLRLRRSRARAGSITDAWLLVQETALDLGIPVPAAESPRSFGARLIAMHGAPLAETTRLVATVERRSYARDGAQADGRDAADAALAVRAALLADVEPAALARAAWLPRSLVVRPGSAFADRTAST